MGKGLVFGRPFPDYCVTARGGSPQGKGFTSLIDPHLELGEPQVASLESNPMFLLDKHVLWLRRQCRHAHHCSYNCALTLRVLPLSEGLCNFSLSLPKLPVLRSTNPRSSLSLWSRNSSTVHHCSPGSKQSISGVSAN